jgi:uncharacterized protein (DUF2062 family)
MEKKRQNKAHPRSTQWLFSGWSKAYKRFLKIRGNPREIALGMALGLFIGMTPVMGLHIATAIPLAALFKWNKISAAAGVWITNPLTAPVIYPITYMVGKPFLGTYRPISLPQADGLDALFKMLLKAPEIFWAMTIGGFILGIPLAIIGYFICFFVVEKYQQDIKRKIALSKEKLARKKAQRKKKAALRKAAKSSSPKSIDKEWDTKKN